MAKGKNSAYCTSSDANCMQYYTKATCASQASSTVKTLIDARDGNTYDVRYISGNCWMVSNLRFIKNTLSSSTSNIASTYTDTNPYKINGDDTGWRDLTSGNSYDQARMYVGLDGKNNPTIWYNYAGASAGTITGSDNSTDAIYDICPAGWRLPTHSEQSDVMSYVSAFNPSNGGAYNNGGISSSQYGHWWSSTTFSNTNRYRLYYDSDGGYLEAGNGSNARTSGCYVRCIRSN